LSIDPVSTLDIATFYRDEGPNIGVHWHIISLGRWCPMEYKRIVQTVVETPTYLAIANKLFSEEERVDIVALVPLTQNVEM
jgi:hypothetical protein